MKPTTVAGAFFLCWVAAPFVFNAFAFALDWKGASISEVVISWCHDYPVLGVLLGAIAGGVLAHWFWPVRPD